MCAHRMSVGKCDVGCHWLRQQRETASLRKTYLRQKMQQETHLHQGSGAELPNRRAFPRHILTTATAPPLLQPAFSVPVKDLWAFQSQRQGPAFHWPVPSSQNPLLPPRPSSKIPWSTQPALTLLNELSTCMLPSRWRVSVTRDCTSHSVTVMSFPEQLKR